MTIGSVTFGAALAAFLLLTGCGSEIGDSCATSTECSAQGDRLCDTSQPGGYCTVPGCGEGSCPSEASCVAFRAALSGHSECQGVSSEVRLQRTFCMRRCSKDSDCRSDYDCVDLGEVNPWGAVVVEEGQRHSKVCVVPASFDPEAIEDHDAQVCVGASDIAVPEPSGAAAGGAGGSSGAAGAAGVYHAGGTGTAGFGGAAVGSPGASGSVGAGAAGAAG